MLNKIFHFLTISLFLGFILFLLFASSKAGLNFDSSYNLLSYQSLFYGKGFVYEYNGKKIPFDPVISTGPELYLPAFFIWKLKGHPEYQVAVGVAAFYFISFLSFLLFYVFKNSEERIFSLSIFLIWFFTNKNLFGIYSNLFVDPLGEVLATCLVFIGFYLLNKRKIFSAFLIMGLAVDTKANIMVALIPTLMIFIYQKYLSFFLMNKDYSSFLKTGIRIIILSFFIVLPYLTYTKIVPSLVLNDQEKIVLEQAQAERSSFMKSQGFGHLLDLWKNPTPEGAKIFLKKLERKLQRLQSNFGGSYFTVILFGISFLLLLYYSRKYFSFYLFMFSGFFIIWWLLGPRAAWYRYFFIPEFAFVLGFITFMVKLLSQKKISIFIFFLIIFISISLPRFSLPQIRQSLSGKERDNQILMAKTISKLDEKKIFTFGWLQCPQLMFLTNKRFQDFLDRQRSGTKNLHHAYFLTAYENIFVKKEMEKITKDFCLIAAYGYNKLYLIR